MRFFSYDNWLNRALRSVTDCMLLSLLWLLASLPFFTVGASTTALYYGVHKVIRTEEGGVWQSFWYSFKTNFKQATLLWLVLAAIFIVLIFSCWSAYVLHSAQVLSTFLFWTVLILTAAFTMWVNYLFPYMARFRDTTKKTVTNCFWICLMNILLSLVLLVLLAVAVYLFAFVPMAFLFVPALYMLLAGYILESVFRKYLPNEETDTFQEEEALSEILTD